MNNRKQKKKTISIILILIILLNLIPNITKVDADNVTVAGSAPGIRFDKDTNDIVFVSNDKTGKTGTRYLTVGWLVRTNPANASYKGITCTKPLSDPLNEDCTPAADGTAVRLDMGTTGFKLDSTDTTSQPGRTISTFRMIWDTETVHNFAVGLDWDGEAGRRNVSNQEM